MAAPPQVPSTGQPPLIAERGRPTRPSGWPRWRPCAGPSVACRTGQRAVVVARFYLGYDVAGTAALLGCAPGTVKAATHQALANLRASGLTADLPEEVEA